jgi:acyl carrier protein
MKDASEIERIVKTFILEEFLPGEDPANLTESTPLAATGILDSIATLRLVDFLERQFDVSISAHEAGPDHMGTLGGIVRLVLSKG